MDGAEKTNALDKPFSKKEAVAFLGISMRTLEYAMARKTISFEKHGRKVVFRRSDLDAYRGKCRTGFTEERGQKSNADATSASSSNENFYPKSILVSDAEDFLAEIASDVTSARKLTRKAAHKILVTLWSYSADRAEQVLCEYEGSCVRACEMLRESPARKLARMDWSFAVATCFLDFVQRLEWWRRDQNASVPLKTPFDSTSVFPNRMLPCLQFIPEAEFAASLSQATEYFGQPFRTEKKTFSATVSDAEIGVAAKRSNDSSDLRSAKEKLWEQHCFEKYFCTGTYTQYSQDLVPFNVALLRVPESVGHKPLSFVGPCDLDALRPILTRYFSPPDTADILCSHTLSLGAIAKLRWLRHRE